MRKWIYITLMVIFILIFLGSGWMLLDYYRQNSRTAQTYDALADMVEQVQQSQTEEAHVADETAPEEETSPLVEVTDPETGETVLVLPEYAQLYIMNNDMVGWIRIDGTRINYPVMQTPEEPNYYLKRDFYKQHNNNGSIYVREQCNVFLPSDNVTMYGHRMNLGSMFADLINYKERTFWEQNRYIRFDTLNEHHTYEIFAVFKISARADNGFQYHSFDNMDETQFEEFVRQCTTRSLYQTGIIPQYGDKLITLSTCEKGNSNMRVVVVAKRIS